MHSKSLLKNFISFLLRPVYIIAAPKKTIRQKAFDILRLFSLLYLTSLALGFLIYAVVAISGYDLQQNSVVDLVQNGPILFSVLLAVIVAPLTEELTFRLFLRFSYKKFAISIAFIIIIIVDLLREYFVKIFPENFLSVRTILEGLNGIVYLGFVAVVGFLVYLLAKKYIDFDKATAFYRKHIRLLFYFSILSFGLIHLGNYLGLSEVLIIAPIFILPQICAGIFLGYIRMNYGFSWSILTHAAYNLLTLLPMIILSLGSESLQKVIKGDINANSIAKLPATDSLLIGTIGLGAVLVILLFLILNFQLVIEFFSARNKQ